MSKKIFLQRQYDEREDNLNNECPRKLAKYDEVIISSEDDSLPDIHQEAIVLSDSPTENEAAVITIDSSSDEELKSYLSEEKTTELLHEDESLPIHDKLARGIRTLEAADLLLKVANGNTIVNLASNIPRDINQNASFIVDVEKIGHWKNLLSDCMGAWLQTYTQKSTVEENGGKLVNSSTGGKTVYRYQYRNKSSQDLHRIIVRVEEDNNPCPYVYVQYYFSGEEHEVRVQPHGNAKSAHIPYCRTEHTTKESIKRLSTNLKPKDVYHNILTEHGGIDGIKSPAEKARNFQQIYNVNRRKCSDPILEVIDMAKQDSSFIRDVELVPEFSIFLANQHQLDEVEKFCTKGSVFSILGVDTTFNIGSYYVTMTTYRNLMLSHKRKSHEPVMIGPALLHQKRTFDSYFSLSSGMIKHKPSLLHLKAIGTDGDHNLYQAMLAAFPFADHLLCDMHMRDNVVSKLSSLGIDDKKPFIEEIFGTNVGSERIPGLVDYNKDEFYQKLAELKITWKHRHAKGDEFAKYFEEHKAQLILNCMSANLRSNCGLGYPPKPYTQNANESINSKVKKELGKQQLSESEFVQKFEQIIKRQQDEVKLSLLGQGEFKLKPEYQHLEVEESKYYRMNTMQKENVMTKYKSCELVHREKESSMVVNDQLDIPQLSILPENCQISTVPFFIVRDMFKKAARRKSSGNDIVSLPGSSSNQKWLVTSDRDADRPHLVTLYSSGQVTCDKNCPRWESFKICAHSLAIAEQQGELLSFLNWFNKKNRDPVYTRLANSDMPSGRGKKAQKATQVRKGATNKPSDNTLEYAIARVQPPKPSDGSYVLHLLRFCDKKVAVCYGCNRPLRIDGRIPPPPNDLVVVTKTPRKYYKDGQQQLGQPGNVYFHFSTACVKEHNDFFVPSLMIIPEDVKNNLVPIHKEILRGAKCVI